VNGAIDEAGEDRRRFLGTVLSATGLALIGCAKTEGEEGGGTRAEVTPGEDLMQEHGVLERILLVHDEVVRRIEQSEAFDVSIVASAAGLVRRFIEDYHERLEEQFVFPRLEAAQRERDLVAVLLRQHARGRQLTDDITRSAARGSTRDLAPMLRSFGRMYRPHAAREDTVLFPAFREIVGRAAYRELGEEFEETEHELFGERGFEAVVSQIADLERALGIDDLARFTAAEG
jgi:hemerythrin-like domain-containing protein